jgi:hypothetical protein
MARVQHAPRLPFLLPLPVPRESCVGRVSLLGSTSDRNCQLFLLFFPAGGPQSLIGFNLREEPRKEVM